MLLLGGAAPPARANTSARAAPLASGLMRLMKEVLQGRDAPTFHTASNE
jgi:hypothetical protein